MIYYAVTEEGHPFNGEWIQFSTEHKLDDCDIYLESGEVIWNYDPLFTCPEDLLDYYGGASNWLQKFLYKVGEKESCNIDLVTQVWDIVKRYSRSETVISIINKSEGEDVMVKANPQDTAGLNPEDMPVKARPARKEKSAPVKAPKKKKYISYRKEYDEATSGKKLSKQAVGILMALHELGGLKSPVELEALLERMEKHITTCQTMMKIFQHYKKSLVEHGFIAIVDNHEKL